jgi:hypothetical protein
MCVCLQLEYEVHRVLLGNSGNVNIIECFVQNRAQSAIKFQQIKA